MRAIVCTDFDQPLEVAEIAKPEPDPKQLLVEVAACGVNFVDGLIVSGRYQIKPSLPHIPGFEVAGTVSAIGSSVTEFKVGQRVFASPGLGGGGYAEFAAVEPSQVFALPDEMSFGQGATFIQSYCTALFALEQRARIEKGQTLVVLGASGGVGRAAVDVGKALGARVFAAASSADRLAACEDIGADGYINYSVGDLKGQIREATGGGADVVYDPLGDRYSEASLRGLRDGGKLLIIGFAAGDIPRLPTNQMLLGNRQVVGVDWGGWRTKNPQSQQALMSRLSELLAQGVLHLREPKAYAFDDASRALNDVNERRVVGKVILTPG